MFQIKICGLTQPSDAHAVAAAGADAIGLNFYHASKRYVDGATAEVIVRELPETIVRVGLFVDRPVEEIRELVERLRLDLVQLHGDESPADLAALGDVPVMKAFRPTSNRDVIAYLEACARLGSKPRLVLLDANVPGEIGGTGHRADWEIARQYRDSLRVPPLVLAGGLTADNVAEAIRDVQPAAVDTASGVETSPGRKDPERIARFVAAARAAFGRQD
jgi:phosphoribosylanthranilate isomerase